MRMMLVVALLGVSVVASALPTFVNQNIQGLPIQMPQGWQVQSDDFSITLSENFADEDAATAMLFALQAPQATAAAVWQELFNTIRQGSPETQFTLLATEREQSGVALYSLYYLQEPDAEGYLSAFTFKDAANGLILSFLFSAQAADFIEFGGPAFPFIVFANQPPELLQQIQQTATAPKKRYPNNFEGKVQEVRDICAQAERDYQQQPMLWQQLRQKCAETEQLIQAKRWEAQQAADVQSLQVMRNISRMQHETTMKILYNMDSGWCYSGESGCN